jgi:hypothetical protein
MEAFLDCGIKTVRGANLQLEALAFINSYYQINSYEGQRTRNHRPMSMNGFLDIRPFRSFQFPSGHKDSSPPCQTQSAV